MFWQDKKQVQAGLDQSDLINLLLLGKEQHDFGKNDISWIPTSFSSRSGFSFFTLVTKLFQ